MENQKESIRFKYSNETAASHEMKLLYGENGWFSVTIDGRPAIFEGDRNSISAFFELVYRIPELKALMKRMPVSKTEIIDESKKHDSRGIEE